uniref:Uncharacterized protein n=1 Tax=Timema douglasi TaxID=61478 RepID=A0A7R8VQ19_TIMDO|nr:unnamed protein product [Timema douglasi]
MRSLISVITHRTWTKKEYQRIILDYRVLIVAAQWLRNEATVRNSWLWTSLDLCWVSNSLLPCCHRSELVHPPLPLLEKLDGELFIVPRLSITRVPFPRRGSFSSEGHLQAICGECIVRSKGPIPFIFKFRPFHVVEWLERIVSFLFPSKQLLLRNFKLHHEYGYLEPSFFNLPAKFLSFLPHLKLNTTGALANYTTKAGYEKLSTHLETLLANIIETLFRVQTTMMKHLFSILSSVEGKMSAEEDAAMACALYVVMSCSRRIKRRRELSVSSKEAMGLLYNIRKNQYVETIFYRKYVASLMAARIFRSTHFPHPPICLRHGYVAGVDDILETGHRFKTQLVPQQSDDLEQLYAFLGSRISGRSAPLRGPLRAVNLTTPYAFTRPKVKTHRDI